MPPQVKGDSMRSTIFLPALSAAFMLGGPVLAADGVDEIRIGVAAHDLTDHSEDGPQITGELLLSPIDLRWLGEPRPAFTVSINTQGFTNLASAGLLWDIEPVERLTLEAGFGLAYHDGVDDLDLSDPVRAVEVKETRALLGSPILFRTTFGADYALSEQWSIGVFYEHYSHGQILENGRNQGLDELGVRLGYRFGR
jgi:lipid A 3-O-deacylase